MRDDDVCLISVATFDRLADRYAEKYFQSALYDRWMVERAGYKVDFQEVIASPANAPKATQDLVLIARRANDKVAD